jgi:tetratricopeptide (TPR) repeat protein
MSDPQNPNGKGFLDDNLAGDIEDWDRGFDSLIDENVETLDAQRPTDETLSDVETEDFADFVPAADRSKSATASAHKREETIAVAEEDIEASQAIGSLLSAGTRASSVEDQVTNPRLNIGAVPSSARPAATLAETIDALDVAEDDVFTSASRPSPSEVAPRIVDDDADFGELIAPPSAMPNPVPVVHRAVAPVPRSHVEGEVRRTPAIVRRTSVATAPPPISYSSNDAAESTRVLDLLGMANQPALESSIPIDDDDYDGIEIDSNASATAMPIEVSAPKRTAHIVRRGDVATVPPPVARYGSAPVIEVDVGAGAKRLEAADRISEPALASSRAHRVTGRFGGKTTPPPIANQQLSDVERLATSLSSPTPAIESLDDNPDIGSTTLLGMMPADDDGIDVGDPAPLTRRIGSEAERSELSSETLLSQRGSTVVAAAVPPVVSHYVPARVVIEALVAKRDYSSVLPAVFEPSKVVDNAGASVVAESELADWLALIEREIAITDDVAAASVLRAEAGRVSDGIDHVERARQHYEAALLDDPTSVPVIHGLRGLAMRARDMVEMQRLLELEQSMVPTEQRDVLARHRIDLLLASGELDLARVAVGEALDSKSDDVASLFAQLNLTLSDGRIDEFAGAMAQLDGALSDPALRASVALARSSISNSDTDDHAAIVTGAHQADPSSALAMLQLARVALHRGEREAAGVYYAGMTELLAQQPSADGAAVRHAARLRSVQISGRPVDGDDSAITAAPLLAFMALVPTTGAAAGQRVSAPPSDDSDAVLLHLGNASLVSEQSWQALLEHSDYAEHAQYRVLRQRSDVATPPKLSSDVWTAATELLRNDQRQQASALLMTSDDAAKRSSISTVALLGNDRRHEQSIDDICQALDAAAAESQLPSYYKLRAALAAMVHGEQASSGSSDVASVQWQSWHSMFEDSKAPLAMAGLLALANRKTTFELPDAVLEQLSDDERLALVLRNVTAEIDRGETQVAQQQLEQTSAPHNDRWLALRTLVELQQPLAEQGSRSAAVATLLQQASAAVAVDNLEQQTALSFRAAQLFIDAGNPASAVSILDSVEQTWPQSVLISDLHALARRRGGVDDGKHDADLVLKPLSPDVMRNPVAREHAYSRYMRQADTRLNYGDAAGAQGAFAAALDVRLGDPGAIVSSVALALGTGDIAVAIARALANVQAATEIGDSETIADAQVQLADIQLLDLRNLEPAYSALAIAFEKSPQRWSTLDKMLTVASQLHDDEAIATIRRQQSDLAVSEPVIASNLCQDSAAILDAMGVDSRRIIDVARKALQVAPPLRSALLFTQRAAVALGDSNEQAANDDRIAAYFANDPRSQAAFLTRAGNSWSSTGDHETAIARFRAAESVIPGYIPALEGWRRAALKAQLWVDMADATLREAIATDDVARRAMLFQLAGVVFMEKALIPERAIEAFRAVLDTDPGHRDAFLRIRILLEEEGSHDELAIALEGRLAVETQPDFKRELHRAAAELHRNFLSNRAGAMVHYRAILGLAPNDINAHTALADIAWELGEWQSAAQALMARARLERSPSSLVSLSKRLGMLHADRLADPTAALAWYERALTHAPDDEESLIRVADLAGTAGDWNRAMAAAERLAKNEADPEARVTHLHRVADIFEHGFNDAKRAERAYNLALDNAPGSSLALDGVVKFYKRRSDTVSIRVHLGRVASVVRARIENEPRDIEAYRVLARTMEARHEAGVDGSLAIARAAKDMIGLLTGTETSTGKEPVIATPSSLITVEADEVLFPAEVQPELRRLFQLLGERLAKHIGVDLRHHGVSRADKITNDQAATRSAMSVASALGFSDIDVYASQRQPFVFAAEPTTPCSVVLGRAILASDRDAVRFATGAALKLAQSQLAVAARLPVADLGVLVIALVRLFQPDFPALGVDLDAVATQMQRLRRLIPSNSMSDLRPFALAVDASRFNHASLSLGLAMASYRAGVASAQSLRAGLTVLAARAGVPVVDYIQEPVARSLIHWALSEDFATVAR